MPKIKPFKKGAIGWDAGCRFTVVESKRWGKSYVYKLKFISRTNVAADEMTAMDKVLSTLEKRVTWFEYQSHSKIVKEKCFHYDKDGNYKGDL